MQEVFAKLCAQILFGRSCHFLSCLLEFQLPILSHEQIAIEKLKILKGERDRNKTYLIEVGAETITWPANGVTKHLEVDAF